MSVFDAQVSEDTAKTIYLRFEAYFWYMYFQSFLIALCKAKMFFITQFPFYYKIFVFITELYVTVV